MLRSNFGGSSSGPLGGGGVACGGEALMVLLAIGEGTNGLLLKGDSGKVWVMLFGFTSSEVGFLRLMDDRGMGATIINLNVTRMFF